MCNYCNNIHCNGQCQTGILSNNYNQNMLSNYYNQHYQIRQNTNKQSLINNTTSELYVLTNEIMVSLTKNLPDDTTLTESELLNQIIRTLKLKIFL